MRINSRANHRGVRPGLLGQGGKINIIYLVVIMAPADSTSETWYQLTNDAPGHHEVFHRSDIHAILAEISKNVIFGLTGRFWVHLAFPG